MVTLAWKNLIHDKVRLVVTLVGIVFALVLILVQFGLFLSFMDTSANIVERSGASLWISAPQLPYVNGASPIQESKRWKAMEVPGVERVDRYILAWVPWKLPSGAIENVQITGFSLESRLGGPWNLTAGNVEDLRGEDTVIVDELYKEKLGVTHLGQTVEISNHRARVVGFTRGIRSFTTAPFVFCSFKNAQNYAGGVLKENQTMFLLVRAAAGVDIEQLKAAMKAKLGDFDVLSNAEMHKRTQIYWVFQTGAGITTLLGAILGLIVGIVVVAQTIYAATVDHIREFGTLKAMGATNSRIYQVILAQAAMSGIFGYILAMAIAAPISQSSQNGNAPIALPPEVAAGTLALAIAMCAGASIISIRKATRIDPAMVFRG
ncbi:FtsX-like permease family protein [Paludibaculum fermentans]|uniref:FtsX-like permease family protein n=1 Tax=Paludibaculum fermentans TaxID=1473598 RepID=A0A7S7NTP3_PALFE|nr:FtsX-like permease family protein [Paludibaculum fermentans]QOY89524.1 FtsX-like permease family protein [Paludibaculum fermentans]